MAEKKSTSFLKRFLGLLGLLGVLCAVLAWQWRSFDFKSILPQATTRTPSTPHGAELEKLSEERLATARSKAKKVKALLQERSTAAVYPALAVPVVKQASTQRQSQSRHLQFCLRELKAYQKLTNDSPQAKAVGEKFIDSYLRQTSDRDFNAIDYQELDELGRAALDAGSNDPLLRTYQRFAQWAVTQEHKEAVEAWSQILQELRQTEYPKSIALSVQLFLRDAERADYSKIHATSRKPFPTTELIEWLEEEGQNSKWHESVCERLWKLLKLANLEEQEQLVTAVLNSQRIDEYVTHLMTGNFYICLAWQHWGRGIGNTVSGSHLTQFKLHADCATEHLEYAWYLHPELPYAPCCLMNLATAGVGTNERPQFWFQRTVEAQFDYYPAYAQMESMLLPRQGARQEDIFTFARNCVGTGRFDTVVPYVAVQLLKRLRDRERANPVVQRLTGKLLREFVTKRNAYQEASPGVRLYDDNGSCRADLVVLMEDCELLDLAAAELQAAGDDINWTRLRSDRRPGRYLAARLIATQGALGPRVLKFDEKLRQPWDSNLDTTELKWLTDEFQELKALTPAGDPAETYLAHAGVILEQLRQFSTGIWAEIQIEKNLKGWEPYCDKWRCQDSVVELIANGDGAGQVNLRPLANFQPPLEIEATVELLDLNPSDHKSGIGWSREEQEDRPFLLSPHFAIKSKVHYMKGQRQRHDSVELQGHSLYLDSYRMKKSGPHRLHLKLWNESAEFSVDDTIWSTPKFLQPWDRQGFLCLGSNRDKTPKGTLRLSSIRIRKLDELPPPAESEPLEVRLKYWEKRAATGAADDLITMARLCKIRFEQRRFDETLSLARQLLEEHPGINDVSLWKARAQIEQGGDEAEALAELRSDHRYQGREDPEVMSSMAEILTMARDASLRNGNDALYLAKRSFTVSNSTHARSLAAQAAAEAELGNYKTAINTLSNAMRLATESEKEEWQPRLTSYEAGVPFQFSTPQKQGVSD